MTPDPSTTQTGGLTRCAIAFPRFGPYHVARLESAGRILERQGCKLYGIETATTDGIYDWDVFKGAKHFERITLFPEQSAASIPRREIRRAIYRALAEIKPEVVAIPGWQYCEARGAVAWCRAAGAGMVLMSESSQHDFARHWWREWIKSLIVKQFDAALVGGGSHADYAEKLGVPRQNIRLGYDVVDNDYFAQGAATARQNADALRATLKLPQKYIFASGRFVKKKNFSRLLKAFASFRDMDPRNTAWELVLCGDGDLRGQIEKERHQLGLDQSVHLPGFIQYDALPTYYGLASAFVHPSTTEQWGLVVNEAMAAGLPVAVSDRCGCVGSLVSAGENGFTFDPFDDAGLATLLHEWLADADRLASMGVASQNHIQDWGTDRFGNALRDTAELALAQTS